MHETVIYSYLHIQLYTKELHLRLFMNCSLLYADNFRLFFAFLRASTRLPPTVFFLAKNPCLRFLTKFDG